MIIILIPIKKLFSLSLLFGISIISGESGGFELTILSKKFETYTKMLLHWNNKFNLTAITEPSEIIKKHYLDSLSCVDLIPENAVVADVGTGAGFPGVPVKIQRPDISLTLMDALGKRINFLKELCKALEIDVECVHIRAEDAAHSGEFRERFDVVLSRAVARLPILSEYCLPLIKPGGIMLALKGKDIETEISDSKGLIKKLGGAAISVIPYTIEGSDITHSIVKINKELPTPPSYPRRGKKIGKFL
mgnify:CR=1 FL=1|jgi:16S rRNA (guanine(527)-N(7))-methyltransferase RsmG